MKTRESGAAPVKRSGLGRGLSALISSPDNGAKAPVAQPRTVTQADGGRPSYGEALSEVDISKVSADPNQPRRKFSRPELEELSASIKEVGILSPLLVKRAGEGYQIIAGERRFRAAQLAGIKQVPVLIREKLGERETLELALIENIQRADLGALEEATAYRRLVDEYGMTQKEVAERVGKDRASVANSLRLLQLPEPVRAALDAGDISAGHAKAILTVKEPSAQIDLMRKVKEESLSVRALEKIVSRAIELPAESANKIKRRSGAPQHSASEIERKMERVLGTRVRVKKKSGSEAGKIEIEFYSSEEFERLLQCIGA